MKSPCLVICLTVLIGCASDNDTRSFVRVERYHRLRLIQPLTEARIIPKTTNNWTAREGALNDLAIAAAEQAGIRFNPSSHNILVWDFDTQHTTAPYRKTKLQRIRHSGGLATSHTTGPLGLQTTVTDVPPTTSTVPIQVDATAPVAFHRLEITVFDSSTPQMDDLFSAVCVVGSRGSQPVQPFGFMLRTALDNFPGPSVDERQWWTNRIE